MVRLTSLESNGYGYVRANYMYKPNKACQNKQVKDRKFSWKSRVRETYRIVIFYKLILYSALKPLKLEIVKLNRSDTVKKLDPEGKAILLEQQHFPEGGIQFWYRVKLALNVRVDWPKLIKVSRSHE